MNSSRISNLVRPSPSGVSVYERTPRNSPSGTPPSHVMRRFGSNSVIFTGYERLGFTSERILSLAPLAGSPSTLRTPESQSDQEPVSARICQTRSGLASIVVSFSKWPHR